MLDRTALMQAPFGVKVSSMRFFCGGEITDRSSFAGYLNLGMKWKPSFWMNAYAKKPKFVIGLRASPVFDIYRMWNVAQIRNAIVRWVTVNVIDRFSRPRTIKMAPGETVRMENFPVYANADVATGVAIPASCGGTGSYVAAIDAPRKATGFRIVIKQFAHAFRGWNHLAIICRS